jgi:hypothetical protein
LGGPSAASRNAFPEASFPAISDPIPLANQRSIRFVAIDSDSEIWPFGHERIRALGRFEDQLQQELPPVDDSEIRVLLLHHRRCWTEWLLKIVESSREALDQFLVSHGFRVILNGHLHDSYVARFTPPVTANPPEVLEANCGTTTRWDRVPAEYIEILGGILPDRDLQPNSLIVHQVVEREGKTVWEASAFTRRSGGQGFIRENEGQRSGWIDV